jgi:hypothetical protein
MNKILCLLLVILLIGLPCCGANTGTINGKTYTDYGLFNADTSKNPNLVYEPSWWNVFWGIVFFELVIPPVYVFGYHLMVPVAEKTANPGEAVK